MVSLWCWLETIGVESNQSRFARQLHGVFLGVLGRSPKFRQRGAISLMCASLSQKEVAEFKNQDSSANPVVPADASADG